MHDEGERYEFLKPIMFTAGVGVLDDRHKVKGEPEEGISFLISLGSLRNNAN